MVNLEKSYKSWLKNLIVIALAISIGWPQGLFAANGGNEPNIVRKDTLPENSLGKLAGVDNLSPEEREARHVVTSVQTGDFDLGGEIQKRTADYLQETVSFEDFLEIMSRLQPQIQEQSKQNPNASFKITYTNIDNVQLEKEIPFTQILKILQWSNKYQVSLANPDEKTRGFIRSMAHGLFGKTTKTDVTFAIIRFVANGTLSALSIWLSDHPAPVALIEGFMFLGPTSGLFALFRQHFTDFVKRADTPAGELVRWGIFEVVFLGVLMGVDAYYGILPANPIDAMLGFALTIGLSVFSQGNGDTIVMDHTAKKSQEGLISDHDRRRERLDAEKAHLFVMDDSQFKKLTQKDENKALMKGQYLFTANSVTSVLLAVLVTAAANGHVHSLVALSYAAYAVYGGLGYIYVARQKLKNGAKFKDLFIIKDLFKSKRATLEEQQPPSNVVPFPENSVTCQSLFQKI